MQSKIGIIRTFVRHPNAANLLMALMILGGLFSMSQLNRQLMPTVGMDAVSVNFIWPGATAEDIISNVLETIEPEIRFVTGIDEFNGFASEGTGGFFINFKEGTNMARAFSDVENGIARVEGQLPEDLEKFSISQIEVQEPVSRIALSGPFPERALKAYANEIRDDLLALGIDRVNMQGVRDSEIWVTPEPSILRQLDLKIGDVAAKIRETSLDQPSGTVDGAYERIIRSKGQTKTVEAVEEIEIISRDDGRKLKIKDIATVQETFNDTQPEGFFKGNRAVSLQIMRSASMDSIDVAKKVEEYLEGKAEVLPASLTLNHYDVRAQYVGDRIWLLTKNGIGGLLLVLGILYVFLNGRLAFWVAAGIPVAMFATFTAMQLTGQSFNMLSLMGLIMTLGIIVDDAIVVGEHAATRRETGMTAVDAAESGATRMFGPVMASSLTTIASFFPIFLITGFMGQMASALPYVVIAVIVASLIECFLILPGHLKHALKKGVGKTSGWRARFNQWFNDFRDVTFRRFVTGCYQSRYIVVASAFAMLIISVGVVRAGHVPFTLFPQAEPSTLLVNLVMNPGAPREQTQAAMSEINRALFDVQEDLTEGRNDLVVATFGTVGQSIAGNSWQQLGSDNLAGLWVELTPADKRDIRNVQILEAWRAEMKQMPGVERIAMVEPQGGPPGREIDIRLSGGSPTQLKQAALEVRDLLERYPGVRDIEDDLPYGKREMILELTDRGRAMGFNTQSVSGQVRDAAQGAIAKRFPREDEEVDIVVKLPEGQFNIEALRELYLRSPQGAEVPLMEIVNIRDEQGFMRLHRVDGATQVAVTADLDEEKMNMNRLLEALPGDGLDDIAKKYGVQWGFDGKAEEQADSLGEVGTGLLVAVAAIYIILAWVLGSYARPIVIILSVIPFGWVGSVMGHFIMGYDMTMLSLIGLLGLTGILVNDSIILVSAIDERNKNGEGWRSAVINGTLDRLRAVILTSLTTIGGLTPLLFETNLQAQFLIPVAITLVFGISVATLIVLIVVPAFLGILDDVSRAVRGERRRRSADGLPAPEGRV
ncbi:MAG: efflux RND transporter permease subunit [Alphaproteobacteria bacterium]